MFPSNSVSREPFRGSRKVYAQGSDPSWPFTDPDVAIDVRAGIAPLRQPWIEGRNETVELAKPSSVQL
jgi:hypothetical protein